MRKERENIFIGVDGGATKTLVRVEDGRGNFLGSARGGAANIRLSVETSWESIRGAITEALEQANINEDDERYALHCGMGLAGTELPAACEAFWATPHPFATLLLRSDAYTSCLGAHGGDDGAIIAVGTGVVGYQIEAGRDYRVGGWGFPHGDEGSGAWLGLEAIRSTLQWRDGRLPGNLLVEDVFNYFKQDLPRLVIWANEASATQFARIAPLVIKNVEKRVPEALELIQQAGAEIDRVGSALARQQSAPGPGLPCCLLGGIAPFIKPWISRQLTARLTPAKSDAVIGAVLMIRNHILGREARPPERGVPFRATVAGYAQLLREGKKIAPGKTVPQLPPPLPGDALKVLLFSPHPDDECITGALPLRLRRELELNVINVPVTLGSREDRREERLTELRSACSYLGFGLITFPGHGLEMINPAARERKPDHWAEAVRAVRDILAGSRPRIIFIPHRTDWNTTHIGTHYLVIDALGGMETDFSCLVIETEFWEPMGHPNLMVESAESDVTNLVTALSLHVGEVRRNPYHLRLPAWLEDNVRRGTELVGGQGAASPNFTFATLYRLTKWSEGSLRKVLDHGFFISGRDSLEELLGSYLRGQGQTLTID